MGTLEAEMGAHPCAKSKLVASATDWRAFAVATVLLRFLSSATMATFSLETGAAQGASLNLVANARLLKAFNLPANVTPRCVVMENGISENNAMTETLLMETGVRRPAGLRWDAFVTHGQTEPSQVFATVRCYVVTPLAHSIKLAMTETKWVETGVLPLAKLKKDATVSHL
jgi:hypothetical protein